MLASDSTLPLAALPESAPLKAVAVGLELLLDRAQLWESTAARHVSLAAQLEPAEQLARRWRRLELQSWRRLLHNVAHEHAAGVLHLVPNSVYLSVGVGAITFAIKARAETQLRNTAGRVAASGVLSKAHARHMCRASYCQGEKLAKDV